jgi:hypothetical protein
MGQLGLGYALPVAAAAADIAGWRQASCPQKTISVCGFELCKRPPTHPTSGITGGGVESDSTGADLAQCMWACQAYMGYKALESQACWHVTYTPPPQKALCPSGPCALHAYMGVSSLIPMLLGGAWSILLLWGGNIPPRLRLGGIYPPALEGGVCPIPPLVPQMQRDN